MRHSVETWDYLANDGNNPHRVTVVEQSTEARACDDTDIIVTTECSQRDNGTDYLQVLIHLRHYPKGRAHDFVSWHARLSAAEVTEICRNHSE